MLIYQSALGLKDHQNAYWLPIALDSISIKEAFTIYKSIVVSVVFDSEVKHYYLDSFRATHSHYLGTINSFHSDLANSPVSFIDKLPNANKCFVRYEDAFRCGFKVDLGNANNALEPTSTNRHLMPDMAISRTALNTDMKSLEKYCLLSINGYYHRTVASKNKAFAINGAKTLAVSGRNHVGITSFQDIATIATYAIPDTAISAVNEHTKLYDRLLLTVPSMAGKYPILILGGYMVLLAENVLEIAGDTTLSLSISSLPYLSRIAESATGIDLSSIGITRDMIQQHGLDAEKLIADGVIRQYLQLSQSFLVLVDKPEMRYTKQSIRTGKLPGILTTAFEPKHPLLVNHGKLLEYWKHYEDQQWCLTATDTHYKNFVYSDVRPKSTEAINVALKPGQSYHRGYAEFLLLSAYC